MDENRSLGYASVYVPYGSTECAVRGETMESNYTGQSAIVGGKREERGQTLAYIGSRVKPYGISFCVTRIPYTLYSGEILLPNNDQEELPNNNQEEQPNNDQEEQLNNDQEEQLNNDQEEQLDNDQEEHLNNNQEEQEESKIIKVKMSRRSLVIMRKKVVKAAMSKGV
jgi:type IV secretory pathway VirB10-like protein